MRSTRISRHVNAPRAIVYRALIDARAVATWMVPTGMTSHVHAFDAREGGSLRISLTYDEPTGTGKTTAHTDTYHGRFVRLLTNEQVVEAVEFETTDPALRGEMTITITLADADGGTDVLAVHDGLPPGLPTADNEAGWRSSLAKLAALVEGRDPHEMKLVSVNIGFPHDVTWHNTNVTTAIFKHPVEGRVALATLNLDGDRQADLSVHGGEHKAVYCYPIEHYDYWKRELPGRELPLAVFGENFTTAGLTEDSVHLGDQFSIGSALLIITQPRLPCYKLGVRFQSDDMVKRFLASGRTGFYAAVGREGDVGAGDDITVISRDPHAVAISEIFRLYVAKAYSVGEVASVRRALRVAALPESWKDYFRERLQNVNA